MFKRLRSELYFTLGQGHMNKGELDEAIGSFKRASLLSPKYFQIDCYMALCLAFSKRYSDAEKLLYALLKKHPNKTIISYYLGICLIESGKAEKAEKVFLELVDKNPENPLFRGYLGFSLLKQKKRKEGLASLMNISNSLNSELGGKLMCFFEKDILEEEVKYREKNPNYTDCILGEWTKQVHVGSPMSISKKIAVYIDKGIELVCISITKNKKEKGIRRENLKGIEKIYLNLTEDAINIFKNILENDEYNINDTWDVWENLFCTYIEDKRFKKAEALFKEWTKEIKKEGKGLELFDKYIKRYPDFGVDVGKMYFALGKYKTALNFFEDAAIYDSKNHLIHYYIGLCYVTEGKDDRAVNAFKTSLEQVNKKILQFRLKAWNRCVCIPRSN